MCGLTKLATVACATALMATPAPAASPQPTVRYCEANRLEAETSARTLASQKEANAKQVLALTMGTACPSLFFVFLGADFGAAGAFCMIMTGVSLWSVEQQISAGGAAAAREEYLRIRDPRCEPTNTNR